MTYYAYVYGSSKVPPKLLFASSSLKDIEEEISFRLLGRKDSFGAIIDRYAMKEEMSLTHDSGPESQEMAAMIEGGELAGPANNLSDGKGGRDYYIIDKAFNKLYGTNLGLENYRRLSIFYFTSAIVDFNVVVKSVEEFVI